MTAGRLRLARNVVLVAGLFALASLMGMVRNVIVAGRYGIGADLDAFYAAFKLPDLLFTVVAGGALATAFIPVLAESIARQDMQEVWRLVSAVTNWVLLIIATLAALAALAAPWLVARVIAPGFSPALQLETARLMRIILLSTLLFAVSAVQGSVLHGFKHFFLPALAPVLYPLGVIGGALWLAPVWGVRGLAVGAVIGAALHLAVKIPALLHYGFRWLPTIEWRSPALRRVGLLMGPRVLDLGVFHLSVLATANLASRLAAGSVSALEWGWDFMQLPETAIGTAIGLVAFPTLAEMAARRDLPALRQTLAETMRAVLTLALPVAAAMILLGRPLLEMLYQRGAFDAASTAAVLAPLRFYALGLVGHACLELAARAFFAQQDTVTPLVIAAGSAALNVLLALLLMGPLGAGGLALANTLAITAEVLVLMLVLRVRWRGVQGRATLSVMGRILLATAAMSLALGGVLTLAQRASLGALPTLALGAAVGVVVYVLAGLLAGVPLLGQALRLGRDVLTARARRVQ
jgi:putative peptidoglycan lipid II flippase